MDGFPLDGAGEAGASPAFAFPATWRDDRGARPFAPVCPPGTILPLVVRPAPFSALFPTGIRRTRHALTVLELMTVLVIISILCVMLAPVLPYVQARAQKAKCIGNLRSLHVAATTYVQDNQHWPQISGNGSTDTAVASAWIAALKPYGLAQINWVCPTVQQELHSPDLSDPANVRVDYLAMPFGTQPNAPFQHSRQPWFIEAGDVHGNGQEIIFPDGHTEEAADVMRAALAAGAPAG